jgi:hypothetical protein
MDSYLDEYLHVDIRAAPPWLPMSALDVDSANHTSIFGYLSKPNGVIAGPVKDVPDERIVKPIDLEEACIMIDLICFRLTSYASNHHISS